MGIGLILVGKLRADGAFSKLTSIDFLKQDASVSGRSNTVNLTPIGHLYGSGFGIVDKREHRQTTGTLIHPATQDPAISAGRIEPVDLNVDAIAIEQRHRKAILEFPFGEGIRKFAQTGLQIALPGALDVIVLMAALHG